MTKAPFSRGAFSFPGSKLNTLISLISNCKSSFWSSIGRALIILSKAVRINSHYLAKTFPVLGGHSPDNKKLIELLQADTWWCEGLFMEASQIAKDYESLSGNILITVKKLILENLRLREKKASPEEFWYLWEIFKQNEVKFNKSANLLTARTVSFFCLMMHRSNEIKEYAEENYRPILTETNNLITNTFTQLACIGERIREIEHS